MPGHNFALFCQYSSFLLCWTSWTNGFTSVVNFGSSQIILLKILLLLFFLFSIWYTNYTYITLFEIFPQFWYVYFILFFLILFSFTFQSRKFLRPIIKHTDSFLSCIMSSNELTIGIICLLYIYIYIYINSLPLPFRSFLRFSIYPITLSLLPFCISFPLDPYM